MQNVIKDLKTEMYAELNSILNYWSENSTDKINSGFIGKIDFNENKIYNAEKGAVMYARILWTFSASYEITQKAEHKELAKYAYENILSSFYDVDFGGVFWSLHPNGTPKDTKKQIYAIAFVLYGFSEYYKISKDAEVLQLAIKLYQEIQRYSYDPFKKGYFEAFTQDWQEIEDLRLSEKDVNEKKTMNTHLHIIEAYANLYKVWKDDSLLQNIVELLEVFETYFINKESYHLRLFFNENWKEKQDAISYGHDIEAAWLLLDCAEITENKALINRYKLYAVKISDATIEGIDEDGGLWYELELENNKLVKEKHWWPQAELLIGFYNSYQLTGSDKYLQIVTKNWDFIKRFIKDSENGEWSWGVYENYKKIEKDKAGFWKCPYHTTRACMEIIKRIDAYQSHAN